MGSIIKMHEMDFLDNTSLMKPLVYCSPKSELINKAVSMNVPLAEKLISIKLKRRTMRMDQCVRQVLDTFPDGVIIKDFDVMFNPKYEIDVLQVLIGLYRLKPFDIIWPGRYEDGKLIYAEIGYTDYKVFGVDVYDITCVI